MKTRRILKGQTFGYLVVLNESGDMLTCRCTCGAEVTKKRKRVMEGDTTSCGCKSSRYNHIKHGHALGGITKEYSSWRNMKERCYRTSHNRYKYYGGKGVKVCPRWLDSFQNFLDDMGLMPNDGKRYSIDRKDADGDYTPENCKWATYAEQRINRASGSKR